MRISDWSSDVCSSDLVQLNESGEFSLVHQRLFSHTASEFHQYLDDTDLRIIRLLDQCEQEHIIKRYFKKAIRPSVFFPAHYDEKMHAHVRPRIEKRLAEAIDQIGRASCRERVCQYV